MDHPSQLRPTPEQYREFNDYLCTAHSWYKHLPLMDGRRFVVFVARDSGFGRLVAQLHGTSPETATGYSLVTPPEGPEFTDEHPRLHYGWKTTKEYRTRFGYLDYMCRHSPEALYARDAGPVVTLPDEVEKRCGFILYPYVSSTFAEAIAWDVHEEALAQLRAGAAHPARAEVLQLAQLAEALQFEWSNLDDQERDWIISRQVGIEEPLNEMPSEGLRKYLEVDDQVETIARQLRRQEFEKIKQALAELDEWLTHGS